jgi:curved DNA-binding protein CbpA
MTYTDLQEAIQILGLGDRATLKEIKTKHRELVKRYHPDTGSKSAPETIRKINDAYRFLLDYVSNFRFSFAEDEFYEQNPEERIFKQFADDPLWGKK